MTFFLFTKPLTLVASLNDSLIYFCNHSELYFSSWVIKCSSVSYKLVKVFFIGRWNRVQKCMRNVRIKAARVLWGVSFTPPRSLLRWVEATLGHSVQRRARDVVGFP